MQITPSYRTYQAPQRQAAQPQPPKQPEGDHFTPSGRAAQITKGLVEVGAGTALGYGLGSAAVVGGFAGAVVGGLTGLVTGTMIVGPAGNGKGGDGLIYPLAGAAIGLVGGAAVGAFGGSAARITGTVLGLGAGLTLGHGNLFGSR